MARMFRECVDENGVGFSQNSHDERDYEHKESDWNKQGSRYRFDPPSGNYVEDTVQEPITRRTMERVYNRPSAMQFEGDLKPRAERMAGKERE